MKRLSFERKLQVHRGRNIRPACFEHRSMLASSTACLVATTAREILTAAFGFPVTVRIMEPRIPDARAWTAIVSDAKMFGVRGPLTDAAFVLRHADALALAAGAFGEPAGAARELSAVERTVLERAVRALSPCLTAVCGREPGAPHPLVDLRGFSTYFELCVAGIAPFRLGIALARDPSPSPAGGLRLEDLGEVEIEVSARLRCGDIVAGGLLDLRPGTLVPMNTNVGPEGLLLTDGAVLASGTCGETAGRRALAVSKCR